MARIYWGHSIGCFIYNFLIQWSVKKHWVAEVLLAIWEIFLHENNCNYNSCRFTNRFLILFLSSHKPKKKIWFSASWWSGNKKYLFFVYSKSCSTLKLCQIQQTFIKKFSYMLFLFVYSSMLIHTKKFHKNFEKIVF